MIWNLEDYKLNKALIDEDGITVSYSDLYDEGMKISAAVGHRCLVFILATNTVGSIVGYTAFVNNNIVPALLGADLDGELLTRLMDLYKPSYVWLPADKVGEYDKYESIYSSYGYVLIKTDFDMEYPLNQELCMLLTTSGSTGSPKFVRQSYKNVLSNAKSIAEYLHLDNTERPITTLPMNYTYGLSIINSHLLVGATILVTDKGLMQKEFWNFFKEEKATSFGGVPYTYEMLNKLRFMRMELPSFRYMTQAGGKLTEELHEKFAKYAEETERRFIVMYGQCEATARMGYLPPEQAVIRCGSMGIAIPGGKFHLIDTEGNVIHDPDVVGELVYEGENVTLGYAECGDDLVLGDERNGILYTGDMARVDKDGYYYISGRKKRFLKIYGNRVNLDETERLIKGHFDIGDVACAGVDDHMYIFISEEETGDGSPSPLKRQRTVPCLQEIKSFVISKTGLNPAAFNVKVIDCIPKNSSGKTLYKELETYYGV